MATRWLRQVRRAGAWRQAGTPDPAGAERPGGLARPRANRPGGRDTKGTVMNALKIAAGACAPLLLAACAAAPTAGHHGDPARQGLAQIAPLGPLGTITGVFHRVGGPLG